MAKKKKSTVRETNTNTNTTNPTKNNSSDDNTQNITLNTAATPSVPVRITPDASVAPLDLDQVLGIQVAQEPEGSTVGTVEQAILQLLSEDTDQEVEFWSSSIYGYILGANPPVSVVTGFINRIWGKHGIDKISFMNNGVFLVRFNTQEQMLKVVHEGYKLFDNKLVVVEQWFPDVELKKSAEVIVPVWMKLHKLPLKYWGAALEKIAGIVGKYMKPDSTTEQKTRLAYARVLIQVTLGELPKAVTFRDAEGNLETVLVEFEWQPVQCLKCQGFGHISVNYKRAEGGQVRKKTWVAKVQPVVQPVATPVGAPSVPAVHTPPQTGIPADPSLLTPARILSRIASSHEGIVGHRASFLEIVQGRVMSDGIGGRNEVLKDTTGNG
ncbi:hypothetical protein vseg_003383 [Gypsophila vaccaria]